MSRSVFRIELREDGDWDGGYGVGYEGNWFATEAEAEAGWKRLCKAIPAYRGNEHRIVELPMGPYEAKRLAALSPVMGRPIDTSSPIGRLAVALGGVQQLADAVGVSVRTVRYWARGETQPGGPARKALAALFTQHAIE